MYFPIPYSNAYTQPAIARITQQYQPPNLQQLQQQQQQYAQSMAAHLNSSFAMLPARSVPLNAYSFSPPVPMNGNRYQPYQEQFMPQPPASNQSSSQHEQPVPQQLIDANVNSNYKPTSNPSPDNHVESQSQSSHSTDMNQANQSVTHPRTVEPMFHSSQSASSSPSIQGTIMRPKLTVQIPSDENAQDKMTSSDQGSKSEPSQENQLQEERAREEQPPPSATEGNNTGGGNSSTSWGNFVLPPPSPSTNLATSAGGGPGNPFNRPPLAVTTISGEQTPLSAAMPNRYVNEMLPSPSNFYGGDWNLFGNGGSSSGNFMSHASSSSLQTPNSTFPAMGSSFLSQRSHLGMDMLPSPLQFSTPIVVASSQSLTDFSSRGDKREPPSAASAGPSMKRVKLESQGF